ncbi:MAG: ABC transporter permease [Candidatus Doudnabacteria bacterium]|nr:ABC transporter permease [Candidatus Doudnabacteria bacterium]
MTFSRIYALLLRYGYLLTKNPDRAVDTFYWPTIDLLVWGLTGLYVEKLANNFQVVQIIISGIVFWYIIFRAQGEISVNLLEEFWSHNLVNIFVSPISFWEWITAVLLNGVIKALLGLVFTAILAFALYHVSVISYGLYLIPFVFLLLISGWFIGFFIAGMILRYGTKIQFLAWTLVSVIAPFSAVYYPVSVLPDWAQKISAIIPTSYVFEGLREIINTGHFDLVKFMISLLLSLIYLALSLIYIKNSFRKALERGLINIH